MKKNKLYGFAVILILIAQIGFLQGCQKYPDGPMVSFHSKTERVANTWNIDNYKINGEDYTSLVSGYSETFTNDGDYSYNWGVLSGTGAWEFQNNDTEIKLTGIDNQSSQTLVILKLEEKQFWYYYMDGNDKKEFHMVQ
ncbi:MAG: hypothetical protein A2W91_08365 [Bacteroidetes bacterium GWF2_38_335]|nr:MAG: hypothetical protein A2W91_08365 [Bacteroidetes bacterium GWF2_38_335]OFY78944.1 MAG: hypothetical protein A2281_02355 [Bacteroidetes bacterium RIFOXYA12_FULL_38_20]HBS86010.1 hypothetical protein [Bacteroidales bacterium]